MSNVNSAKLYQRLRSALVSDPIHSHQKFLPLNILEEEINEDCVRLELPWTLTHLKNNHVPGKIAKRTKKVFVVLVMIGECRAIRELLREGLCDDDLPLHPRSTNENVLISGNGKEFRSFLNWKREQGVLDFINTQWMVIAPIIPSDGSHIDLDANCTLPFTKMEEVGWTKTSTVYKSDLHGAHFHPRKPTNQYTVAVKEFRDVSHFEKEKDNLNKLLTKVHHNHLIRHYATIKRDKLRYIVFPWAEGGSVRDFWNDKNVSQPKTANFVLWCLKQFLGITEALQELHNINCRHGDIKPENILCFKESERERLVIADVGVSRNHFQDTRYRVSATDTRATTPSYEAPETVAEVQEARSRKFDTWSLGCIFLEFAIWILRDVNAIAAFTASRNVPEFYSKKKDPTTSQTTLEIHPVVTSMIKELRQDPRCAGKTAMGALIDIIDADLLKVVVDERASAEDVVVKLKNIVKAAESDLAFVWHDGNQAPPSNSIP